MMTDQFSFLVPYFASIVISLGVGIYAWYFRKEKGAFYLSLFSFLQASMTFGFIQELTSGTIQAKLFWDNTQFIGMLFVPLYLLLFSIEFTGGMLKPYRRYLNGLWILATIFLVIGFTDSIHGWVRSNTTLILSEPYPALTYDFGVAFWLMVGYVYLTILYALGILVRRIRETTDFYRNQLITIIIGVLIPLLGAILTLVGFPLGPHRDITPFTFALGNLVISFGFFRYGLLDILPIARTAIIDGMSDPVVVLDASDRVVDLNPAAQRFAIEPGKPVVGRPAIEAFPHWFDMVDLYKYVDDTQTEISLPGEGTFDFHITSLRDRVGNFAGRVIVVRDITHRHLAQQQLHERTVELEVANTRLTALTKVKDEFVANVSHELRTPITNLKLYLNLVKANPKKYEAYMATFTRETERLASMIEGLLTLSRLDQESIEVYRKPLDLNQLVRDFIADREALTAERGLKLSFTPEEPLPRADGDENLIGQVIGILMTNAINYTEAGGEVELITFKGASTDLPLIGLQVRDTGAGIPKAEQETLFERFFRGKMGRKSQVPGTGLGLAIAKEIIQLHEGTIEVESEGEEGKGSTFTVWLPVL